MLSVADGPAGEGDKAARVALHGDARAGASGAPDRAQQQHRAGARVRQASTRAPAARMGEDEAAAPTPDTRATKVAAKGPRIAVKPGASAPDADSQADVRARAKKGSPLPSAPAGCGDPSNPYCLAAAHVALSKKLTNTDIQLNRVTLPDPQAITAFFGDKAFDFDGHDLCGGVWPLRFRFWQNRTSRMYILSGMTDFMRAANADVSASAAPCTRPRGGRAYARACAGLSLIHI